MKQQFVKTKFISYATQNSSDAILRYIRSHVKKGPLDQRVSVTICIDDSVANSKIYVISCGWLIA